MCQRQTTSSASRFIDCIAYVAVSQVWRYLHMKMHCIHDSLSSVMIFTYGNVLYTQQPFKSEGVCVWKCIVYTAAFQVWRYLHMEMHCIPSSLSSVKVSTYGNASHTQQPFKSKGVRVWKRIAYAAVFQVWRYLRMETHCICRQWCWLSNEPKIQISPEMKEIWSKHCFNHTDLLHSNDLGLVKTESHGLPQVRPMHITICPFTPASLTQLAFMLLVLSLCLSLIHILLELVLIHWLWPHN